METQAIRLRLVFEDRSVLNETQLSDGMNQSWLLIEPNKHEKISDVCNHLLHIFDLRRSCPNGILLYMEGFVLPPSESTRILKDKEILCVKRKEIALAGAIEGADAGNLLDYVEVNRKEPVNNGMLLLANEEFDKETGGYQSESEEEKLEDEPSPVATASKKRKASTKSRSSKKKKHRSAMDGVEFENQVATEDDNINDDDDDECCTMKIVSKKNKLNKERVKSSPKVKRKKKHHLGVVSGGEGEVVRHETCNIENDELLTRETISKKKIKVNKDTNKGDADISYKKVKSPSSEKRSKHLQDKVQGVEETSTAPDWVKKGPSRSARRKKAKRQWKRELAIISQKPDIHLEPEVSKAKHKEANGHPKDHMPMKPVIEEEKRKCNGNNTDTELVACVVKPGHIRFEPLDEGDEAKQIEVPPDVVGFEWNGISSKKKGQKWGIEKYSTPRRDDFQKATKEASPKLNVVADSAQVLPMVDPKDFEMLPMCTSPKEGDVIAYRLVELSSSWTPELSSYRVGKISHFDANNIVLNPVPEYPIVLGEMNEDGPDNNSLYKEDGSLEIQFAGLVDVRNVKQSKSEPVKAISNGVGQTPPEGDEGKDGRSNMMSRSSNGKKENNISKDLVCRPVVTNDDTWGEVMEALNAKKSQLLEATNQEMNKGSEWNRWSYRALRSSALGPTMALLRSNNNI